MRTPRAMHFAKSFKSSPHSISSPNGKYVATLVPGSIAVRSVASLAIVRTIKLAPDLSDGVTTFVWSSSSKRLLVAVADRIHVFSAPSGDFHGLVQVPQPLATKPAYVTFGATDGEVCVFSPVGIKLTTVNLASSKAVEIGNPKFFSSVSASKGYSFRPGTHHMALLTRTAGKDIVSIHSADTREIQRSWYPDTIDAQGLAWTPDGNWLVVWDSSAHGTRVLFCTHDGHVFRDWRDDHPYPTLNDMGQYGPGVRTLAFSPNGRHTAIASGSSHISILNDRLAKEVLFRHATIVEPNETLQIWQEQIDLRAGQQAVPSFVRATQALSPPGLSVSSVSDAQHGCNLAKFDSSSTLLASRLDDAPSTIWIWDIPTCELRAVLMYHASVTKVEWHPSQPELLLMRCEGEGHSSVVFVWDPLSDGPRPVEFARHLSSAKVTGRADATWLETLDESAALFFTDHARYVLFSLVDADVDAGAEVSLPWATQVTVTPHTGSDILSGGPDDNSGTSMDEGITELDDTFHFKKSPIP
ncbi:putative WD40 domain-containing protein [Rosellinia necatrix]|uniref:Putative WD40 domain-containing protein n=1 Tax=Rosellinia necatrix TaxID=77044 RepID=A0A1W2TLR4_ROSNE|nr:putative WD40 domain-containing protein [Rosellinia necatrix]